MGAQIIKEGNSGVAYTWDDAQMQWEKIGTVVEGPDDNDGNVAVPSKVGVALMRAALPPRGALHRRLSTLAPSWF